MDLPKGLTITFLGHASFRLDTPEGKIIYVDAWLDQNPVCPEEMKKIEKADLFLVTHGHGDHLDNDLVEIATRTKARVIAPAAVNQYLKAQGLDQMDFLQNGGTTESAGVKVTMTQAYHASHVNTPGGPAYPHAAVGYVVEVAPDFRIYFAGDTGIFGDMKLIGDIYHPQISVLPIGDRATMGPLQASHAARMLQSPVVIPFHYGTFPFLTGTAEQLKELVKDDKIWVRDMKAGESWRG